MASTVKRKTRPAAVPVVMRAVVRPPATVCGDCRHHIPRATAAGSWCGLRGVRSYGEPVELRQMACRDFAGWPEGSPVPAFLAAMRF
jgi:hypothetical protein